MVAGRAHRVRRDVEHAIVSEARAAGFALDDDQRLVANRLARLATAIHHHDDGEPLGVYLHGPAGRGKTWIADAFFRHAPVDARQRVHFHGFLEELHRAIFARRTAARPTPGEPERDAVPDVVAAAIADAVGPVRLLVFDEFHVHDPGDARLLTLLLQHLFDRGIAVVATSNYAPEELLPSPIWHHIFEPGIALLRERMDVVQLGGARDYREGAIARDGFAAGQWILSERADERPPGESARLEVRGRGFDVVATHADKLVLTFAQLCEVPTSPIEYLDWASRYARWTVWDVPSLDDVAPPGRQRFVNAVDVLADRGVAVTFVSSLPLEAFIASAAAAGPDAMRLTSRMRLLAAPAPAG